MIFISYSYWMCALYLISEHLTFLCVQLVLESPKDGRQYMFELNDRLIRDKELDGLTEIPVKPSSDCQADEQENSVSPMLQGWSCLVF